MPQYLVAIYHPNDFDPSLENAEKTKNIDALNREMMAAGARRLALGISPARTAKTVQNQPDGTVLVTDGPYTQTSEHMGGFWLLQCADMDDALGWARKAAVACGTPTEVRELLSGPAPKREE
jgi:hypothetical protein